MEGTILIDTEIGAAFELPFYLTVAHDGLSPAPLWSPDGRYLAIDVHADDSPTAGVWIYPTGGAPGAEFRLDADLGSMVGQDWAWSPDGAKLAVSPDGLYADEIFLFKTGEWTPQEYAAPGSVLEWLE
jgi:dipeptidyl aminopeptidase/acylaminoacyl peptidase